MAPSCCRFLWGLWLPLIAMVAAAEEQVQSCSGTCGNQTISYPFWLTDRLTGRSCGSPPDFAVTCVNNTPVLASAMPYSYGFSILNISYEKESVQVVDQGKLRQLPDVNLSNLGPLPPGNFCSQPMWNISAKLGIHFTIDPVNLNLTIYNCTKASPAVVAAARRDGKLEGTTMRCQNESKFFVGMEESYALEGCDAVFLPVLGGANGTANASNYDSLIHDGFILTWKPPPPLARTACRNRASCNFSLIGSEPSRSQLNGPISSV